MSKKFDIHGDALLEEVWHATKRAPRPYPGAHEFGCDVLGAAVMSKSKTLPKSTKMAPKASRKAPPPAPKGTGRVAAAAARAVSHGQQAVAQAKRAQGAAKAATATAQAAKAVAEKALKSANPAVRAAARKTVATAQQVIVRAQSLVTASARAAQTGQKAITEGQKKAGKSGRRTTFRGLASGLAPDDRPHVKPSGTGAGGGTGGAMLNVEDADAAIQRYLDKLSNDSDAASGDLQSQIDALKQQLADLASGAGEVPPPPPGDGGGGGGAGGGGGDESAPGGEGGGEEDSGDGPSASEAVQRFRESGGADDALDDEAAAEESSDEEQADEEQADEEQADEEPGADTSDDSVFGAWYDYLNPLSANNPLSPAWLYKQVTGKSPLEMAESLNKPSGGGGGGGPTPTPAPEVKVSPALAARLAASKKRLADTQAHLAEFRAAQLKAGASVPSPEAEAEVVMGIAMDEVADILLDTYEHEVTDQEPDYERGRGSAHRGAAYMESITYPPGGSSSAPGYLEDTMETDTVLGCTYTRGLDVLGAGPPRDAKSKPTKRAAFVMKKTATGRKYVALAIQGKHGDHKRSIKNARDVGKRAVSIGKKVVTAAKKGHVKPALTKVHGAVAKAANFHHRVHTAAQIVMLGQRAINAGKAALVHADKHEHLITANTAHLRTGVQSVRAKTRIHGDGDVMFGHGDEIPTDDDVAVLGAYAETIGDEAADDSAALDDTAGLGPAPTTAPPLVAGQDYAPDPGPATDQTVYTSLPEGAIVYDGSRGFPDQSIGSWNHFYGGGDGYEMHGDGGWWMHRGENFDPSGPPTGRQSTQLGWGPIVGHGGDYTGLRFDDSGKQFFWYRDKAPAWATANDDLARLNQAILDYRAQVAAAAADAAAQAAQDQLDAQQADALAKQQAAEDAATARQQEQEQAQAEHEAAVQAVRDEAEAHRQELADEAAQRQAEAQADVEARAAETAAAMQPPSDEEGAPEEEAASQEEEVPIDEGSDMSFEQAPPSVMGALRGIAKLRARRAMRR